MKEYKYNLLGANIPKGYRFVKNGERFARGDVWWQSDVGIDERFIWQDQLDVCSNNFPVIHEAWSGVPYEGGYLRKIENI